MPFEDESFDVVFAGEILEHVREPTSVLMNIYKIVKRQGRVLITIPNETFYLKIKFLLKKIRIFNFLFTGISLEKGEWHLHHDFNKKRTIRLIEPYFNIGKIKSIFYIHYIFLLKKV
jgi:2-polyprenyl-3-methyl-5-hydroxy-6-metoxy-1,4-benzoquinol methylase